MISGQWVIVKFQVCQNLHKITHNSMKNSSSTPILTNFPEVHQNFEANLCSDLREQKFMMMAMTMTMTMFQMILFDINIKAHILFA